MTAVAIIGMGAMGSAIAGVIRERGARVVTTLEGRSPASSRRAEAAGVELLPTLRLMLEEADAVLSVVPPQVALALGVEVSAQLADLDKGQRPVYADCNAIAPETVRKIETAVTSAGALFADLAILGSPPRGSVRDPYIPASGKGVGELSQILGDRLKVEDLHAAAGQASGLKMCYAAYTKGVTALGAELLVASERIGVSELVINQLSRGYPEQLRYINDSVPKMLPKAHRWAPEMEEIAATFSSVGLTPLMMQGAAEVYRFIDDRGEIGKSSPQLDEIVSWLSEPPQS
jgi:3-hydroxyisobutyrate dehydrogenase-like beta-hydroxyacid dehydrogenase